MEHAEFMEKMKELLMKKEELRREIKELEKEYSQYYIGILTVGDGDYWDEYYVRLGYVTKDKVDEWRDKQEDYDGIDVMTVDKETFDKYGLWLRLHKAVNATNFEYDTIAGKLLSSEDSAFLDDYAERIQSIEKNFIKDFVKHPSFMHISDDEFLY